MSAEKQKTILLVEDEAITAMAEKMTLEKYGYKVITANTGEQAVAAVETTPAIDLVLMDINLGAGIDGSDAAAIILSQRDLPVVFLSSHTEPEVVAKTEKITSYGYVVKNSSITVLDASIKMAFKLFEAKVKEMEKEDALRESEQRLNFHINNSPLAAIEWTSDFILTRWSGEAEKIFGWNQSETIGKSIMDLKMIYDEDIPIVQKMMERLNDGSSERVVSTNRNCTKEGKTIFCEWYNSVLLNPQGKMISVMSQGIDITERQNAKEALKKSENEFRLLAESMPQIVWITQPDGWNIYFNQQWVAYTGLTLEESYGHGWNKPFHPDDQQRAWDAWQNAITNNSTYSLECRLRRFDGVYKWWLIRGVPVLGEQGAIIKWFGTCTDIDDMKKSEAALQESEEKYRILIENSHDIIYTLSTDGVFTFVSPAWTALLGHPLTQVVGKPFQQFVHPDDLPGCMAWLQKVIKTGQRQEGVDAYRVRHADGSWRLHTSSAVPLRDKAGMVIGFEGTARDITERKQTGQTLQESEKRLKDIIFSMADWVWEVDANGVYTYSSEKGLDFLGSSRGDIIGKTPFDFMSPEEVKRVAPIFSEIVANKMPIKDLENWNIGLNGEMICLLTNGVPILDEKGNLKGYRGVDQDITERRQAESQREAALEKLRSFAIAVESSSDAIGMSTPDGKHYYQNKAFEDLFGDIGENPPATVYVDEQVGREVFRTIMGGNPWAGEIKMKGKAGELLDVFQRAYPIKDSAGKILGLVGVHTNITERKRAESQRDAALAKLLESEHQYKMVSELTADYVYKIGITVDGNISLDFVTDSFSTITGRSMEDARTVDSWSKIIHPDDLDNFRAFLQGLIATRQPGKLECRSYIKDNQMRWIEVVARPEWNGQENRVTAIAGAVKDITERKQAESQRKAALQELQESKALIDAVVENVPLMIFLKEATDLRFVVFNRAGEELLGHNRKELLGKNNLDLFPPEQAAHFMAKDREVLDGETGMLDIPEEPILTAGKGTRLLHTRKVCIRGADGSTKYLLGISEDITERKQAETEIKKQLEEKEILLKEVHHRIKNNIASIGSLISLRLQSITNPEAAAVLQDAIGRVDSMRILYDKLLLSEDYADISVKNYLETLIDTIAAIFPDNVEIRIEKRIADFHLGSKKLFPLGIIINELLTNILKYAFNNRKTGSIKISLVHAENQVTLTIQDDGVGLPAGFDVNKSNGFGLMLVKMLSQQLGGSFSMEKQAGTRCMVEFNI